MSRQVGVRFSDDQMAIIDGHLERLRRERPGVHFTRADVVRMLVEQSGSGEHRAGLAPDEFYIIDTRTIVGNCALLWAPKGQGYTCDLDGAGLFTFEQASSHRETDIPLARDLADRYAVRHVRVDTLCQNANIWPSKHGKR